MFWADRIVGDILEKKKDIVAQGKPLVIRDEKTASGRVHVGSLRGVAIHGLVAEVLKEKNIPATYLFEINDFDPMDGLPVYLDEATFAPHMGKPLCEVPSPDGKAANFAEYFAQEFIGVIEELGFHPEYYRSSELYKNGSYNEAIRLALTHADHVREIYKRVSGSVKKDTWLPLNVICENCGKVSTTVASDFDGETVAYTCYDLEWTKGCRHSGRVSPFDGRAKLPWKIEWAAKFKIKGVDVEGGGKDHSTKGGSREVAETISREVFGFEPPYNIPYEFFQVGGKKMSSSKGKGSSSRDIADLLPPEIVRLLLLQKEPNRVIDFIPDGDTVPILFDGYDRLADIYFTNKDDDGARVFSLIHAPAFRGALTHPSMPRFSQIAYLVQMPHLNIENEVEKILGKPLDEESKKELEKRARYAKIWISTYAPDDYKFEIQKELPEVATHLSDIQKQAIGELLAYVQSVPALDGQELHTKLHDIKEKTAINPQEFFRALYLSILGKDSGPKAGWFLSVLDKTFLEKRLHEVVQ